MLALKQKNKLAFMLFLVLVMSLFFFDSMTLESFKSNKLFINEFITKNYSLSVFFFFVSCIVLINSPVPFAAIIKMLSGFFFGFYLGAIYNIAATILACLVGFSVSRYAFKDTFEEIFYERIKKIEYEVEKNGFYYFLTLRLIMVVPYFLINILAGISRISFKKYLFSTALGVIPASLVYANGGNKLEQINSIAELYSPDIIIALALIATLALSPLVIKKYHQTKY
ncbi:MAG: TVP38/TMEM64 family protein [Gammaproteobacteria bacterium HGW-Gammaproteobacteria-3]|nr:MAG: TVP38/TMEM64 family protein [Gammaproteobacteria bacterium HGW-Gammaproteobacteria-3]